MWTGHCGAHLWTQVLWIWWRRTTRKPAWATHQFRLCFEREMKPNNINFKRFLNMWSIPQQLQKVNITLSDMNIEGLMELTLGHESPIPIALSTGDCTDIKGSLASSWRCVSDEILLGHWHELSIDINFLKHFNLYLCCKGASQRYWLLNPKFTIDVKMI